MRNITETCHFFTRTVKLAADNTPALLKYDFACRAGPLPIGHQFGIAGHMLSLLCLNPYDRCAAAAACSVWHGVNLLPPIVVKSIYGREAHPAAGRTFFCFIAPAFEAYCFCLIISILHGFQLLDHGSVFIPQNVHCNFQIIVLLAQVYECQRNPHAHPNRGQHIRLCFAHKPFPGPVHHFSNQLFCL